MPYCPHCAFPIASKLKTAKCPNCGRNRVFLVSQEPQLDHNVVTAAGESDLEGGNSFVGYFLLATAGFFLLAPLVFESAFLFGFSIGLASGLASLIFLIPEWNKKRNIPVAGYLDHLRNLETTKASLKKKITELEHLVERQKRHNSERSHKRLELVSAALKNRRRKLDLIRETEFIIESKRHASEIENLAQELASTKDIESVEKRFDQSFTDISEWLNSVPSQCISQAGTNARRAIDKAFGLQTEIMEKIEDRLVTRALDGDSDLADTFALEKVHDLLQVGEFESSFNHLDLEEMIAADDEYSKINAEIRLLRDGIQHDFDAETDIEME